VTLPIGGELPARRMALVVALGAGLTAVALLFLLVATLPVRAASPNPDGCPDGYHFEASSGVGCVQDSLPPNARYSYTSQAICNDPFIDVRAPGPNDYGRDPNVTYLVECITAEEAARRAGEAAPVPLGTGPLDDIAGWLADGDPVMPDPKDSDLGGLAATAALMIGAVGAAMATGSALAGASKAATAGATSATPGGGSGAAQGPAPVTPALDGAREALGTAAAIPMHAVGGLTTAAGSGLPLPRAELVSAGLSIARSMKRLTDEPDPTNYSPGDMAQLLGDAAQIGALATILAPATGLVSLAGSGAATAADAAPAEVFDRLRRGFGQLGYMQGVLDENVSAVDGKLAGLDGTTPGAAGSTPPPGPGDPAGLSNKELRALRAAWAEHADCLFDALIEAQAEMADLDNRRRNLAHQIDAVNDLLIRLDDGSKATVPPHLGETLTYGLGWFAAGNPARMAAALRESRTQARAEGMAAVLRGTPAMARASALMAAGAAHAADEQPQASTAPPAKKGKPSRGGKGTRSVAQAEPPPQASAPLKSLPFAEWAAANGFEGGRMAVLQALAGLERWSGFYDALTGTLQRRITQLRQQADAAGATRRMLSSEMQHRTLEAGR
jgi:hypothetical protein